MFQPRNLFSLVEQIPQIYTHKTITPDLQSKKNKKTHKNIKFSSKTITMQQEEKNDSKHFRKYYLILQ